MSGRNRTRRWLIVSVSTIGLLAFLVLAWWRFQYSKPVGSGPAGPTVRREAFSQAWSDRPVLLVGIGDSITAGFGARKGYSYLDRLIANPRDEFADMAGLNLRAVFPNLTVTNLSVSGSTSLQHAEKQIPRLMLAPTNVFGVIVMTTGGNDIIHNYGREKPHEGAIYGASLHQAEPWIANFEERLDSMFQAISAMFFGGCQIVVGNIYDPTDGQGDIQWAGVGLPPWKDGAAIHARYNEVIGRVALRHRNVHVIDLHRSFLGHGIHCTQFWSLYYKPQDPHYWYHDNLEDPNERGYDAIRRLFLLEMANVFAR